MAKYVVKFALSDVEPVTIEADTFDPGGSFIQFFNSKTLVPVNHHQYDHVQSIRDFVAAVATGNVLSITKTED